MMVDENAFAERFREAVRRAGGPSAVARELGKSLKTLNRYMTGETQPGFIETEALCRLAGVSLSWMVSGDGGPVDVLGTKSASAPVEFDLSSDEFVYVPILDVVASAGLHGSLGTGEVLTRLPFPRELLRRAGVRPGNAHFLTAGGDSMTPTIADGAIVLVDAGRRSVADDGIYAVVIGDQVRLKRVLRGASGSLTLISDNRDKYPPEQLHAADAEQLRVAGKVFWAGGGL